jgi:hypothetical protein
MIKWKNEVTKVKSLSLEGKTLQEIGDIYGVSRERIRQVLTRYCPELKKVVHGKAVLSLKEEEEFIQKLQKRTGRTSWKHESDLSKAMSRRFVQKRQNVKKGNIEWSLLPSDIVFPTYCPILGIELDWFTEYRAENSPSFRRLDKTKGYVPDNVIICSYRANRLKKEVTIACQDKSVV